MCGTLIEMPTCTRLALVRTYDLTFTSLRRVVFEAEGNFSPNAILRVRIAVLHEDLLPSIHSIIWPHLTASLLHLQAAGSSVKMSVTPIGTKILVGVIINYFP